MVTRCATNAGMSAALASGTSSQTTPTVEGGSTTFGVSGGITRDIAEVSDAPVSCCSVAPEPASSTATALTVAGIGSAFARNSSYTR